MTEGTSSSQAYDERRVLANRREDVEQLQRKLLEAVERLRYDSTSCFAIRLALEEAISNAFKHGNKENPDKTVTVSWAIDRNRVAIEVVDQGGGFDPRTIPDPREEENIEIPAGRGIVLMQSFMTDVHFHPPGNRVQMVYVRPK